MSMFRSAADLSSSSDSESQSDSEGKQIQHSGSSTPRYLAQSQSHSPHKGKSSQPPRESESTDPDSSVSFDDGHRLPQEMVDLNVDQHANVMTAALLEFYCQSRAADILNAQRGSSKKFSRQSPEAQYLGKKLYKFKSQFLSSHGILADGIDREDMGPSRQTYRDNLDLLGLSALEEMNIHDPNVRSPTIGPGEEEFALTAKSSIKRPDFVNSEAPALVRRRTEPNYAFDNKLHPGRKVEFLPPIPDIPRNLSHPSIPFFGSSPVGVPLIHPTTTPTSTESRYSSDFDELKILGRGSFGEVYHVTNLFDGQDYAVKKIPLSQRRLEQLQFGGQNQLEVIMKEIRTLARLDHANIVRYFGAWAEQAHHAYPQPAEYHPAHETFESSREDLPLPESPNEPSLGIVFEHSETSNAESQPSSLTEDHSFSESIRRWDSHATSSSRQSKKSSRRGWEDEDEDIESIPRNFDNTSYGQTSTFGETDDIFTDGLSQDQSKLQIQTRCRPGHQPPAVILHIQMSLHPISLGSYLNPQGLSKNDEDSIARRHCFHLIPSLKLLLEVISGVEYVHAKGIVHRDLKPANIFLSAPESTTPDICVACSSSEASPIQFCSPRIGDFGLVADISNVNEATSGTVTPYRESPNIQRVVGTEFYRPPASVSSIPSDPESPVDCVDVYKIDEKLDVYALGVILFETIYRLNTKMERQFVLRDLTRGSSQDSSEHTTFPADFAAKIDHGSMTLDDGVTVAESLMKCIKGMLEPRSQDRWSCQDVKEHLRALKKAVRRFEAS